MSLKVIVIWYNVGFVEGKKSFTTCQAIHIFYFASADTIKPSFPSYSLLTNEYVRF